MNVRAWLVDDRIYIGGSLDGGLPTFRQDQNHLLTTTSTSVREGFRHWFSDKWQMSEPVGPDEPPRQWAGGGPVPHPTAHFRPEKWLENARRLDPAFYFPLPGPGLQPSAAQHPEARPGAGAGASTDNRASLLGVRVSVQRVALCIFC